MNNFGYLQNGAQMLAYKINGVLFQLPAKISIGNQMISSAIWNK